MLRRIGILLAALALAGVLRAQDGLNLPTELYVLTNAGVVQRYGLGAMGVTNVTPEGTFVLDFGVAPDGNWLAYRTETTLELLDMYTGESSLVDTVAGVPPFRGRGDTLVWSPAGDALAYTTPYGVRVWFNTGAPAFADIAQGQLEQIMWSPTGAYLAAEAEPSTWWLYRRDGSTLALTSVIPSSNGIAWVSAAELVFAPDSGGLSRMDLANGNRQTLLLDETWIYSLPFRLPDGTLAVFGRQQNDAEVQAGFGRLLGLAPDAPRVSNLGQSPVELRDLHWAPGGELLVAFRGGVLALVIPASGQGLTLPVADAAMYSWGPPPLPRADRLPLPADGLFLTPDENDVAQVWRLPADGSPPEKLTTAAADITAYALSPDAQSLVYSSGAALWLQPLAGASQPSALADVNAADIRSLAFSPDGALIVYDMPAGAEGGIWLVAASGGDPRRVLANGADGAYHQPQFSPAADSLLAAAGGTAFQIVNLAAPDAPPVAVGSYDAALWLSDGRILVYGSGVVTGDLPPQQPVILINPADGAQTPLATIPYPARIAALREIEPGQVRLVIDNALPGPRALTVVDLRTDTGALSAVGSGGFMVNPVLAPDGRWLAGQTHAGGPLTFRNLPTGQQWQAAEPPAANAFRWTSRR